MDAYLCRESYEPAVAHELKLAGARLLPDAPPGLVVAELLPDVDRPDPAFASQSLPDARAVRADSVSKLAHAAFESVASRLDAAPTWTLHCFAPELDRPERLEGRARLVAKELEALLKRNLARAHRRRVAHAAAGTQLLQVVVARPDEAWVSLAPADLSRWPLGRIPVPDDPEAPSSAYRKVEEAYALLALAPAPGETVTDLGAAPGGWSWTALKRGARVTAVDRAKLLPPVAGHPLLTHLKRDATAYAPETAQDWLLCDAIMEPAKTLAILETWLAGRLCKRFVVNVKFKGADYGAVPKLRALLRRTPARARVKQLGADKNEVTCVGTLD